MSPGESITQPEITSGQSSAAPPNSPSASGPRHSGTRRPLSARLKRRYIVLTGNPNCGKTTLFNALTGLRAKVANYAGVTVERKEGKLLHPEANGARVLDLPGTYSLSPQTLDEQVSRDVLLNRLPELPPPAVIVVVVDASNLQRHLYYATQVIELAHPTLIALNMIDVAEQNGHRIDAAKLQTELGVPVIPIIGSTGFGVAELKAAVLKSLLVSEVPEPRTFCALPEPVAEERDRLAGLLSEQFRERGPQAAAEALLLLSNEKALASSREHYPEHIQSEVRQARKRLEMAGLDWRSLPIQARYGRVSALQQAVTTVTRAPGTNLSDRLDRVLTHKLWGTLIFLGLMTAMFQSIFVVARIPMQGLQTGIDLGGHLVRQLIPPGDLSSLLVDGVIAGVGAVLVFLPQILLLFLFIGFLEDTGYMARAAFLMDRLMSKVGLHGKSFIPMLSSFACAIPGIMATRTIESPKDRLATILIAPLMSCSARLPVYTLLIGACIPDTRVLGFLRLQGLTMLAMYLLGAGVALGLAWLLKKTLLRGEPPLLILELPPYKRPLPRVVARHMWDRGKIFLRQAGTIILGINIILWFLATYPRNPETHRDYEAQRAAIKVNAPSYGAGPDSEAARQLAALDRQEAGERLRGSFAGHLGRLIEPVIAPLGFDWKIGIGIISSFAAREIFVSSVATVYNMATDSHSNAGFGNLIQTLQQQKRPNGAPMYTTLTGLSLMVFYVFALQCASTVAVVRRETNSWKWPLLQWLSMGALAWCFAFAVLHIGRWLGYS